MYTEFLGHSIEYWLELENRRNDAHGLEASALLEEVVKLRGKVAFYESRINQMSEVMGKI